MLVGPRTLNRDMLIIIVGFPEYCAGRCSGGEGRWRESQTRHGSKSCGVLIGVSS